MLRCSQPKSEFLEGTEPLMPSGCNLLISPARHGWSGRLALLQFLSASWICLNVPLTLILTVKYSPPTGELDLDG